MGGGGGTTIQQRPLSAEEKALYAQQVQYMQTIQPAIDLLISKGMENINNAWTPDWGSLAENFNKNMQDVLDRQNTLLNGGLPQQWTDAKQTYYDRLYENTMGQGLKDMAASGVVSSSRFNTAANDWQKNLSSQMSQDYSNDVNLYNNLLNTRANWLTGQVNNTANISQASRNQGLDYIATATGAQKSNTDALGTIGQNEDNRTYITQDSGGGFLGGLVGGIAGSFL